MIRSIKLEAPFPGCLITIVVLLSFAALLTWRKSVLALLPEALARYTHELMRLLSLETSDEHEELFESFTLGLSNATSACLSGDIE